MEANVNYCTSTHGGAGYASGSYWDGDVIVCGNCGERIANPPQTGARWVDGKRLFSKGHWEPVYGNVLPKKPRKLD